MKKADRQQAIDIITGNTGAPVKVQFGATFKAGGVVHSDEIVLIDSNASIIKQLHKAGFSLSLNEAAGGILIDKY